ncbi:hypothetical protein GXW82_08295 [Streptacidiphilus sp. 4-A2]|nr:hypothetical protein [Streptacidiphilus sp. 4-A2]
MPLNRRTAHAIACAVAAGALVTVSGCHGSAGAGAAADATSGPVAKQAVALGTAAESDTPDPAVPGARSGGTVTVLQETDFSHLDPARVYSAPNQTADLLLARQLTSYQYVGGVTRLVGDLATGTGTPSDGDRTWTFTLKQGIKYQDGSPITAQDVKYGVERTFEATLSGGPTYLQTWLTGKADYSAAYPGPWNGQDLPAIQTPDSRTIVFHLTSPHADFPYAVAMQAYSPVPKAHDTRSAFDLAPFSSGPYMIQSHQPDKSMVLVRSPGWNQATDPVRHAYPDEWKFEFGGQALDIDQRLIAANGSDTTAMTFSTLVTSDVAEQVLSTPSLMARTVDQVSPFSTFFDINNRRVTDPRIRQALLMAFPREQVRQIFGGPLYGDYTNTILSRSPTATRTTTSTTPRSPATRRRPGNCSPPAATRTPPSSSPTRAPPSGRPPPSPSPPRWTRPASRWWPTRWTARTTTTRSGT